MDSDVGVQYAKKEWEQEVSLVILSRILAQSPYIFRQRVCIIYIVRVSLTVTLKELLVPMIFRIVHPYISIHSAE